MLMCPMGSGRGPGGHVYAARAAQPAASAPLTNALDDDLAGGNAGIRGQVRGVRNRGLQIQQCLRLHGPRDAEGGARHTEEGE